MSKTLRLTRAVRSAALRVANKLDDAAYFIVDAATRVHAKQLTRAVDAAYNKARAEYEEANILLAACHQADDAGDVLHWAAEQLESAAAEELRLIGLK